ncbi:MAG: hypothetical protein AB7E95_06330 [Kiritimatiellales bacterium]
MRKISLEEDMELREQLDTARFWAVTGWITAAALGFLLFCFGSGQMFFGG